MNLQSKRTIVHIEVLIKRPVQSDSFESSLKQQINAAFQSRSLLLCRLYQETSSFRVTIGEAIEYGQVLADGFISIDENTELVFHFYRQANVPMGVFKTGASDDNSGERYRLSAFPHNCPSSSWETLVYEEQRQYDILYELLVMQALEDPTSGAPANPDILNCNRLALLTGPPGTGKTTLCKALANKVAIRSGKRVFLAEINCQNILSKWYSESGKIIQGLFDELSAAVSRKGEHNNNSNDLMFILFDEIESLLINRANLIGSSEPSDSIRAVNALLTQLDRLKNEHGIFVLATSNFIEAIDPAFISRVDIHFETGRPKLSAVYKIMTEVIEELIRLYYIEPVCHTKLYLCCLGESSKL